MADYNLEDIPNLTKAHTQATYLDTNDLRIILREKLNAEIERRKSELEQLRERLNTFQDLVREVEAIIKKLEREYFDVAHSILK